MPHLPPTKHFITLTTHGHRVERRRRRQRHARADEFGRGGAATAWAAAALSARACRLPSLCAARERSGAQGSVAARGNAAVVAAAAAAAARAGGLIRTGRSDRLGGRRRSRRKLSIYVQKPPAAFVVAQCAPVKRMDVLAPAEGLRPSTAQITQFVHGIRILLFARVGVYRRFVNGTASATRAPCGQSP